MFYVSQTDISQNHLQCKEHPRSQMPTFLCDSMNRTRKAITKVAHILVLEVILRNIGLSTIKHNENLFRTIKLSRLLYLTFTFRAILTTLGFCEKNRYPENACFDSFWELPQHAKTCVFNSNDFELEVVDLSKWL